MTNWEGWKKGGIEGATEGLKDEKLERIEGRKGGNEEEREGWREIGMGVGRERRMEECTEQTQYGGLN